MSNKDETTNYENNQMIMKNAKEIHASSIKSPGLKNEITTPCT